MNRLTIGPLAAIRGAVAFEYEGAFTERVSLYVGPLVAIAGMIGVQLYGGMRVFPLPNDLAPRGFWLGMGGLISYVSTEPGVRLDAMVGYTFISEGGFTTSFGIGARPFVPNALLEIAGHLNLGYAF
jgi:hypothetical protein